MTARNQSWWGGKNYPRTQIETVKELSLNHRDSKYIKSTAYALNEFETNTNNFMSLDSLIQYFNGN